MARRLHAGWGYATAPRIMNVQAFGKNVQQLKFMFMSLRTKFNTLKFMFKWLMKKATAHEA